MRQLDALGLVALLVPIWCGQAVALDLDSAFGDLVPPAQSSAQTRSGKLSAPDLENAEIGLLKSDRLYSILANSDRQRDFLTRAPMGAELYRRVSPSVVLVLTEKGLGSGSIISDGQVLTNWHVIDGSSEIFVVFKPRIEGDAPQRSDAVSAKPVKVDRMSDLALLSYPKDARKIIPITFGSEKDIEVGADVHAIGHPTGETWTYTKGVISQFRRSFKWTTGDDSQHQADIIQTQTPINPGNSGGPLLNDKGELIGVNSFKGKGEGLNFAVSIESVRKFIASPATATAPAPNRPSKKECEPKTIYEGRNKDDTGYVEYVDLFCSGKASALYFVPDDKRRSIRLAIDLNGDGKPDLWIYDWNRDGLWDYSLHSSEMNGKADLIGYHSDGKIKATRVEPYDGQPTPWAN